MAASSGSGGSNQSAKDKAMAARLKRLGIERTTQVCPLCYRTISCHSIKSRYTHRCPGGREIR